MLNISVKNSNIVAVFLIIALQYLLLHEDIGVLAQAEIFENFLKLDVRCQVRLKIIRAKRLFFVERRQVAVCLQRCRQSVNQIGRLCIGKTLVGWTIVALVQQVCTVARITPRGEHRIFFNRR